MAMGRWLATAGVLLAGSFGAAGETLTVVSWGGSYGRASQLALFDPFSVETGIDFRIEDYNGGLAQIRAQVEAGRVHWDVVDLETPDLVRGCDEGLLELVDIDDMPPGIDGTRAAEDYLPGAITECGGCTLYYSTVYAYNAESFPDTKPATIEDFFDLAKFPGRRGMRRVPYANVEFALMADGVALDEVYGKLATPHGMDRAFAKLDTIKDQIIWWEAGAQPPQLLADREVAMSTAYNGRIFNAQVIEQQPFVVVWDGQVLDSGGFGIVIGTPNLAAARQFLTYAARPVAMAAFSKYISYSPARGSATALVSTHLETGVDMQPFMPNTPANLSRALRNDWRWWSDHADEVNERFGAWLAR